MTDKAKTEENIVKVSYFHEPAVNRNGEVVEPIRDGRLIATVATKEIAPGQLAVAVSRCNHSDQPSRFSGRMKALARLNRFLAVKGNGTLDGEPLTDAKRQNTDREIRRRLVFTMGVDDFKKNIIESNPFLLGPKCPYGRPEE